MIQNERQCRVTKTQIGTLQRALEGARAGHGKVPPQIYRPMIAGIESLIEELRQQLREYEELQTATSLHVAEADELPDALVKARIARGYTQQQLAERLGLQPQQVQRYEATGYRSASLRRLLEVMKALDLRLEADIPLRPAADKAADELAESTVGEGSPHYRRKRAKRCRKP